MLVDNYSQLHNCMTMTVQSLTRQIINLQFYSFIKYPTYGIYLVGADYLHSYSELVNTTLKSECRVNHPFCLLYKGEHKMHSSPFIYSYHFIRPAKH